MLKSLSHHPLILSPAYRTINVGWVDRWIGEDAAASLYKLREITRELGRSFELLPAVWVVGKKPALSKQARREYTYLLWCSSRHPSRFNDVDTSFLVHPRRETTQGSHGPSIAGRFVEALGGLGASGHRSSRGAKFLASRFRAAH